MSQHAAPAGSIVIPAHNEETVLGRLLRALTSVDPTARFEIVVVPNGCTDRTAEVARGFDGVAVVELEQGSKQAALNAADAVATAFPRLYVDADVELSARSAAETLRALGKPGALAGRPPLRYLTDGCERSVQRFYRARSRTSVLMSALWGAGVYGVSAAGRQRWGRFPLDEPDDLFVDRLFARDEFQIVDTDPVLVHVPHTADALLRTLRRVYRTPAADPESHEAGTGSSLRALVEANLNPRNWPDLAAYVKFALIARRTRRATADPLLWERDDTSR